MRPRPRSRAQVLPLAQSLWAATANGFIPQAYYRQTVEYVTHYQRLRQIVDEICAINRELLCRRERL